MLEIAIEITYFGGRGNQNPLIFIGNLLKLNERGAVT